jgi:crotonobetainyl-CoA:carnitine CoA-transferase CaiB-like acyl-CoA transferase
MRLFERVDVVVENFRPGSMDRLGLGYEQARARNPKMIYCSISGYGQDGPSRELPAMDLIVQASSGLMSVTGPEGGPSVRCGHSVADITAGMFAAFGILLALHARDRTGAGQFLDVSMFDGMVSAMASNYATYLGAGIAPGPMGSAFKTVVPYRAFSTADRDIVLAVGSEKLWAAFCEVLSLPALAADPLYSTNALRVENRATLEPMLAGIFSEAPSGLWLERLAGAGIPCSLVRSFDEVHADPQSAFRRLFPVLRHPRAGEVTTTGLPVKLENTPGNMRFAAPTLGQHTRAVLHSLLCLNPAELDELETSGVIPANSK